MIDLLVVSSERDHSHEAVLSETLGLCSQRLIAAYVVSRERVVVVPVSVLLSVGTDLRVASILLLVRIHDGCDSVAKLFSVEHCWIWLFVMQLHLSGCVHWRIQISVTVLGSQRVECDLRLQERNFSSSDELWKSDLPGLQRILVRENLSLLDSERVSLIVDRYSHVEVCLAPEEHRRGLPSALIQVVVEELSYLHLVRLEEVELDVLLARSPERKRYEE